MFSEPHQCRGFHLLNGNVNVALNITKQTNKYRLLGREWLIIDQTMYKNLQYMSTVQVIPSYKQILKANKHNLHTNLYTHWKPNFIT
jgi:hypothetical protein